MFSKTEIVLSAAIVLSTTFTALAATEHRRVVSGRAAIHNTNPDYNGNSCPASGGPSCSDACLPSGPPCRTKPDSW
jgi:hypothetical protein